MHIKKIQNLFLKQSYLDSWDDYKASLKKDKMIKWDYVILTASNEAQALTYENQIKKRILEGRLPKSVHYAVLPDPDGKRVGSGGATFNVLKYIKEIEGGSFKGKRILVIHSGGDSKRVPQYSACGKLFSPVPRMLPDGRRSTLFDEFIISMSGVAPRIKDGMLVLSGDVLLLFNPLQIDFQSYDAAAISIKENVKTGQHHGVFLSDTTGYVKNFLHKIPENELRNLGAVNDKDNVNIDTGAILLSGKVVDSLYSLVDTSDKFDKFVNEKSRISFYADFVYPLAKDSTKEQFYKEKPEGDFTDELYECRTKIWDKLSSYNMKLISLSPAEFIHFGTTGELLSLMTDNISSYEFLEWKNRIITNNDNLSECAVSNAYMVNCVADGSSYVEDSVLVNCTLGKNCVISNVELSDKNIPDNTVLHGLKLSDGKYVIRKYTVDTNPKENDMWNQPLFVASDSFENSYNDKGEYKTSLCESFNNADTDFIINYSQSVEDKIKAHNFISAIKNKMTIAEAEKEFYGIGITEGIVKELEDFAEKSEFGLKTRIYYYMSKVMTMENRFVNLSEDFEIRCFETIQNAILKESIANLRYNEDYRIKMDDHIVELPIRVNFGGGWSDTPPFCNENGGTVLNAAVKLNGELPIVVKVKKLPDYEVQFESADAHAHTVITDVNEIVDCKNPYDMFALHKAALIACGVIPRDGSVSLEEILKNLGGGIFLSTGVKNIPRGSGLGTSSILSGACLKAIFGFLGEEISENELYSRVVCMEQLMSTGGGWQDQVGGLTPGFKYLTTTEGIVQDIKCETIDLSDKMKKEFEERYALIYTGQRRLARNLLREVVGKYISADKDALYVLSEIQDVATLMRQRLLKDDFEGFVKLLNKHLTLSKTLDNGCTNSCIDQIFVAIEDLIDAKFICGAGGGGFLQVILKKNCTKQDLKERLSEVFQESGVDVWNSEFYF